MLPLHLFQMSLMLIMSPPSLSPCIMLPPLLPVIHHFPHHPFHSTCLLQSSSPELLHTSSSHWSLILYWLLQILWVTEEASKSKVSELRLTSKREQAIFRHEGIDLDWKLERSSLKTCSHSIGRDYASCQRREAIHTPTKL